MRFGLLGTGYWAREIHGAGLAAHPGTELAGVWGRDAGKAAELAAHLGTRSFADLDELLAEVDAVSIALPPAVQAPLAERAALAGKHLLLEKPLAMSVAAADKVVAAVEETGVASVIFFTNRFRPEITRVLDTAIAAGGWNGGRVSLYGSIYGPDSPYAESTWRQQHGGLWDVGPHALSILIPVLGQVTEVTAMGGPRQTTFVIQRHASGAVSTMELTLDAAPLAGRMENVLHGESGWVTIDGFNDTAVPTAYSNALDQLLAAVPTGRHPLDVHFGREVVAIIAAIEESAVSGQRITLAG